MKSTWFWPDEDRVTRVKTLTIVHCSAAVTVVGTEEKQAEIDMSNVLARAVVSLSLGLWLFHWAWVILAFGQRRMHPPSRVELRTSGL